MKHRRLEMLPDSGGAKTVCLIGRREALGVFFGGALVTYTACGTKAPSYADADAGAGDDGGDADAGSCDSPVGVDVGDVSNFPVGSWVAAGSQNDPYIVGQDANGYFAFSAICTHQGCQVGRPDTSGKTICPCHGAEFDGNGAVLRSPARSPLPHYAVTVCGGHVYVDSSTTVAASTRTPAS